MYINSNKEIKSKESIMAHKRFVYIEPDNVPDEKTIPMVMAFLKNCEGLGFSFDKKTLEQLSNCSSSQIENIYNEVFSTLEHLKGADVSHTIMYPNFPDQVMEMDESELYFNAFIHYLTDGQLVPDYDKKPRFPLIDKPDLIVLSSVGEHEFNERMIASLCSSTSVTPREKDDLIWYFNNCNYKDYLPENIPFKENAILAATELLKQNEPTEVVSKYIKTPTDTLRFAIGLSGGDISLAKNSKFKNFSNSETKMLLSLLDKQHNPYEMLKHREEFVRLGEKIHPGTKINSKKYPNAFQDFSDLRNDNVVSIGAYIERAIKEEDFKTAVDLLTTKNSDGLPTYNPGEFATRLDKILRITPDEHKIEVLETFKSVAKDIKPPTLLRTLANFEHRLDPEKDGRCVIPKGNISKITYLEDTREEISSFYCKIVKDIIEETLVEKFKEKSEMGKVYMDTHLDGYKVSSSARSSSDGLTTLERGSEVDIKKNGFITPFIHWKEKGGERTDVDLSVGFYDKDMNRLDHVYYCNLKNDYCCHSGDFVSAKDGASEFVSIDRSKVPANVKYAMINVHGFTGQPFSKIGECFVGYQEREYKEGEVFEPSTVKQKIDLTSGSQYNLPAIFDLEKNKMIWMDIPCELPSGSNIRTSEDVSLNAIKAILNRPSNELLKLIDLNVQARGEYCNSPEEADIIFTRDISRFNDIAKENAVFVTPFDRDIINTQLLGEENKEFLKPAISKEIQANLETSNVEDLKIEENKKVSIDEGIDF